jgi:hypothetical protein
VGIGVGKKDGIVETEGAAVSPAPNTGGVSDGAGGGGPNTVKFEAGHASALLVE